MQGLGAAAYPTHRCHSRHPVKLAPSRQPLGDLGRRVVDLAGHCRWGVAYRWRVNGALVSRLVLAGSSPRRTRTTSGSPWLQGPISAFEGVTGESPLGRCSRSPRRGPVCCCSGIGDAAFLPVGIVCVSLSWRSSAVVRAAMTVAPTPTKATIILASIRGPPSQSTHTSEVVEYL
jgi:hypothetical protein